MLINMKKITLHPTIHRGKECMCIRFPYDGTLHTLIKKIQHVRWSQTHKCWYLPLHQTYLNELTTACKEHTMVDVTSVSEYLKHKLRSPRLSKSLINERSGRDMYTEISRENFQALIKTEQHLVLKSYSSSTITTYLNEIRVFMKTIKHHPAESFTTERVKDYLQYCAEKLKLSENTLHSRMNALKFYYEQVLGREKFFWEIPRPKKRQQLPHFFNQDEIVNIIKAAANIKHKAMLMLAYSAGLRVSEVVALKTNAIDSKRMCIYIRNAKGKKDRFVTLSPVMLVMLREYSSAYRPLKNGYLFSGQIKEEPYSVRSLQMILSTAKKKAGIVKPGNIHALRHSFATHLLDKGTDVTMIMKLLGHNDIKTTLRYLHVTNRDMLQVISPLDDLKFG